MLFDVKTVNKLLGIDESYKAPEKMLQLMLDDQKRVEIFKKFLEISTNMQFDWFHEYFEDEQTELDLDDNSDDSKQVELFDEKGEPKDESKEME